MTLNRVSPHASDANEWNNQRAGRFAMREALRRAGLADLVPPRQGSLKIL